ncbi:MAG: hypothetical protein ACTSRG_09860 [Candidatus Helarchaeota archaeon]
MSVKHISVSMLKEWSYCHCTAKFWGKPIPKVRNDKVSNNFEDFSKMFDNDKPLVTDEFTVIPNNYKQRTTFCMDNGLFLMGSVDFILLDKLNDKCFIFNMKKTKKLPRKAYKSDKNLLTIYNLLLFRFLHREKKKYQIRWGFEFLENYQKIVQDISNFEIGEPGICYTTNKKECMGDFLSDPITFFKIYKEQIFFIDFDINNVVAALNQIVEMIDECKEPYYIERNHKNLKKCQNCYYNKIFSCNNSLK